MIDLDNLNSGVPNPIKNDKQSGTQWDVKESMYFWHIFRQKKTLRDEICKPDQIHNFAEESCLFAWIINVLKI